MRLLEFQAKNLLSQAGVKIPHGEIVDEDYKFSGEVVLKIQVPTGKRGKSGGVVKVSSSAEFDREVGRLKKLVVDGFVAEKILAEDIVAFENEHYVALIVDRDASEIRLIAHQRGGIDVEENSKQPLSLSVSPATFDEIAISLQKYFSQNYDAESLRNLIAKLYDCMIKNDALLLEINPLVFSQNEFIALDCKMEIDDNSLFRHPKFGAKHGDSNLVTLDELGNVAVIANGAGLAMATIDQINDSGLRSTNFLDIGGGADADAITEKFSQLTKYPNLQAIIINVFAGITKCDEVASAIIAAKNHFPNLPPLYIRLTGTNFSQAKTLLDTAGIPLCETLADCILLAKMEIKK